MPASSLVLPLARLFLLSFLLSNLRHLSLALRLLKWQSAILVLHELLLRLLRVALFPLLLLELSPRSAPPLDLSRSLGWALCRRLTKLPIVIRHFPYLKSDWPVSWI